HHVCTTCVRTSAAMSHDNLLSHFLDIFPILRPLPPPATHHPYTPLFRSAKRTSKRNLNPTAINHAGRPFSDSTGAARAPPPAGPGPAARTARAAAVLRRRPYVKKGRLMEKYSVKKPFTVLVAVLIVFLLGFVSVTNLRTDLLPEISTPYLMVVTVYPGASPEKVETEVSEVLESALGTVAG